ncbi:hypothetical protein HHK36_025024 [Tetracentron sinense]|uniref:ZZ-type domain-containing protein n=1 Tax=Tetracentron sinense TaxID=13715 RepID=A0A835D4N1_TETSI|nr:hypothetical protein HHK36_025024 [Tetracentron sinense]
MDNAKNNQKESDGHLSWNSIASATSASPSNPLLPFNLQASRASEASVPHYSALNGDSSKQLPDGNGNFSASQIGFNHQDNHTISGQQIFSDVMHPSRYNFVHPFKRSCNYGDRMVRIHKGVRCDVCGIQPITGPWFKSKVKKDYDMCRLCFSEMGNEAEYIRMDCPLSSPRPFFGFVLTVANGSYTRFPWSPSLWTRNLTFTFTAPERPGRYISYWRMALPSGQKFGQQIWVLIEVDTSLKGSLSDWFHGLDLNLTPEISGEEGQEITDVNVEPAERSPNITAEFVKPMVIGKPNKDRELDFPVNDGLLVGSGVSVPVPPTVPASKSHPIIDFSVVPSEPYPVTDVPTSSGDINKSNTVEKTFMKSVKQIGFKQIDLNKDISRMNEYNLKQSEDDLCGVLEWDPFLEEMVKYFGKHE